MIYTDKTITSTGLPIPQTYNIAKFGNNILRMRSNTTTWLDYFYDKDVPYVSILRDQWTQRNNIICSDEKYYKLFSADLKCPHGVYFLDSNDTVITFLDNEANDWVRLSLLPEARKDGSNDDWIGKLLLAKTMLPTSIWMLMCILGFDYDTLTEEVLRHEVEY